VKRGIFRQALLILGLAFLPGIGQAIYYRHQLSWQTAPLLPDEVKLAQVEEWGDAVLWVDARPNEQFAQKHVPGAVLLNEDHWQELLPPMLAAWSPEKKTVVYCSTQSCALSHEVARRLKNEAGLKDVFVLHGGWEAWLEDSKE
jgi:rhodanese-related sulfurtransferase